ncbi:MAG: FtsW/RodA/SpoVE family cell cycle protein, partial [Turicibacter sp.]
MDPFNHDYGLQNVMGYTAIALGGLFGVGIGNSTQKYGYVIEPHNDFIVTIVAEELGVITVLLIMVIYFIMAMRCFMVALKCEDKFGSLLSIGIGSIFLVQPVINLGGASGFIPLTGVTLPFISYGGSSMMTFLLAIGVYLNVHSHNAILKKKENEKEK